MLKLFHVTNETKNKNRNGDGKHECWKMHSAAKYENGCQTNWTKTTLK